MLLVVGRGNRTRRQERLRCGHARTGQRYSRWFAAVPNRGEAKALLDAGSEVVDGDLTQPETLAPPLRRKSHDRVYRHLDAAGVG
ncbi:MAG: hypothetical protein DMG70_24325 [Acidobacteria bacterium]|nr:MAG: hypothetical protein DMG70_24325 [Acidobacteriota bacterium]PYY06789.1 MAG: hypothetical protein DMG69_22140 [Acidobacteriota bacterium]